MKKLLVTMLLVGGVCGSVKAFEQLPPSSGVIREEEFSSGDGRIYPIDSPYVYKAPRPEGYTGTIRRSVPDIAPVRSKGLEGQGTSTLPLQEIAFQLKTLIKNFPASLTKNLNSTDQSFLKNALQNLNNMLTEKTVLGSDSKTWGLNHRR